MHWRSFITVAVALISGIAAIPRVAQSQELPFCYRVGSDYRPDGGDYFFVRNRSGYRSNFAIEVGGERRTIPMADPTIMKLGEYFYVTGTSDAARTGNFAIYKSKNLVQWEPHKMAFPEGWRDNTSGDTALTGPFTGPQPSGAFDIEFPSRTGGIYGAIPPNTVTRVMNSLNAPQFFYRASDQRVFLIFNAIETTLRSDSQATLYFVHLTATEFADTSTHFAVSDSTQPGIFQYSYNSLNYKDGGWAASLGVNPKVVPTSGVLNSVGSSNGQNYQTSCGLWNFVGIADPRAWMRIDGFIFQGSSLNSNNRWMMYTWDNCFSSSFEGIWGISAYRMESSNLAMDETQRANLTNVALPRNATGDNSPGTDGSGVIQDGELTWCGERQSAAFGGAHRGIAEGPSAFEYDGRTYILFSRNSWEGAGYNILYKVGTTFENAAASTTEHVLLSSVRRTVAYGPSYGHGEVFFVPGRSEPYLVFHRKEQGFNSDPLSASCVYSSYPLFPSDWSGRSIYFKELTIDSGTGLIRRLWVDGIVDDASTMPEPSVDPEVFIVPSTLPVNVWCPTSDYNNDGASGDDADIAAFFSILAGGPCLDHAP